MPVLLRNSPNLFVSTCKKLRSPFLCKKRQLQVCWVIGAVFWIYPKNCAVFFWGGPFLVLFPILPGPGRVSRIQWLGLTSHWGLDMFCVTCLESPLWLLLGEIWGEVVAFTANRTSNGLLHWGWGLKFWGVLRWTFLTNSEYLRNNACNLFQFLSSKGPDVCLSFSYRFLWMCIRIMQINAPHGLAWSNKVIKGFGDLGSVDPILDAWHSFLPRESKGIPPKCPPPPRK